MDQFSYQLNYDAETYTVTHYSGADETVTISESFLGKPVTILFDKLFAGHDEIRSISIPVSVTDLGEFLIDGCVNLHHIELPPHLRYLWGYTFCTARFSSSSAVNICRRNCSLWIPASLSFR